MPSISIVCPVFNEGSNISEFVTRIKKVMTNYPNFEIIFSVDPSTDGTEQLIRQENLEDSRIKMVLLSRRFGQPAATLAGLDFATGDAVVIMDVDLQDPPELIPEMIEIWLDGSSVVLAERKARTGEPFTKKIVSKLGYAFLNRFSDVPIPRNTGDFRLLDKRVVAAIKKFPESNGFLRGLGALAGFDSKVVYFDRPERFSGKTKYNQWLGSLKIAFNGLVGFSTALLKMSTFAGVLASLAAFLIAVMYGVFKLLGAEFPVGNPTIVITVLLMGGLNLLAIGILGLYIGRIYDEVKNRPRYITQEVLGFDFV